MDVSERFTREKRITIKQLPVPETSLSQLDLSRKLLDEKRESPDVLGVDVIWPYALKDHLVDLRPYFAKELSGLDPELVAAYTVDGKLIAIPYQVQVGVLEYRADLLHEYGYHRPPKTWGELERAAERIQAGERAKGKKDFWGYVWQGAATEGLTCNGLEWQVAAGGGRIIEADETISVNNDATVRAWQRAKSWVGSISPPSVTEYRELDSMNAFDSGRAAFRRTWQWNYRLGHRRGSLAHNRTGYTSMPGGPGGRVGTLGGFGLAVSRYSANQEAAIEFVRYLLHAELADQTRLDKLSGPVELIELPSVLNPGNRAQGHDVVVRPSNLSRGAYEEVTRAYIQATHSVLTDQRSAHDAAVDLEKRLVAITGFKVGPPMRSVQ